MHGHVPLQTHARPSGYDDWTEITNPSGRPSGKGIFHARRTNSDEDKSSEVEKPNDTPQTAEVRKNSRKDAMFMGLGDVIFPGMLIGISRPMASQ